MNALKFWFKLLLIIFNVLLISCESKHDKRSLLIDKNNSLNTAFSNKNWEAIYELKFEASKKGIGSPNWHQNWDKNIFINEYSSHYLYGKIEINNLSFDIFKDSAETINLIKIITIPTNHIYADTTFNYWAYKDNNWYLKNWDVRLKQVKNEIPDSVFDSIMKKIRNN